MPIPTSAFAHMRLTVTDIDRSRVCYDEVFGGAIYQLGDSLPGRRPVGDDQFSENRTGLDHVGFAVGARSDLEDAAAVLDARGHAHAGIEDIGSGYILEFRDPDNIALEPFAPRS